MMLGDLTVKLVGLIVKLMKNMVLQTLQMKWKNLDYFLLNRKLLGTILVNHLLFNLQLIETAKTKLHSFGSMIYSAKTDAYYEEKPYENIEVVDRIGSGDAYISGALYSLLTNPDDYQRAVEIGNAISSLKNTIPGDLVSTSLEEITSLIEEHKSDSPQLEMNR